MMSSELIEAFVHQDYLEKDIMHGWPHIHRLLCLAKQIANDHQHDPLLLTLGAYFHGNIYNREPEIKIFLELQGFSQDFIDKAVQVAWESQTHSRPETIEGVCLHDAHLLEGGKTFLITKSLVTGTARGQSLEETIHFIEENVIGKFKCFLPESQVRYEEKEAYAKAYIADLKHHLY